MSSALTAMQAQVDTSSLFAASEMLKSVASNQLVISPEVSKSLSQIGQFSLGEYTLKPEVTAAIANLSKIAALQSDIAPATRAMSELAKHFASYKFDIPPAITELQQRLSEINMKSLYDSDGAKQDNEEENRNG